MPLTDEQAKNIKEQLLKQTENFPEDKREQVRNYISSMDNKQLEDFLIQNQMISRQDDEKNSIEENKNHLNPAKSSEQCVYCLLGEKKIDSLALYEDKDYLAVLEINPFSDGQVVLIPKKHLEETKKLKSKALTLANRIGKHLVKKLRAENFQITTSNELKHAIVNIIPVYKDKPLKFERKPIKKEHLQDLALKIGKIEKKQKAIKISKKDYSKERENEGKRTSEKHLILPRRLP